MMHMLTKSEDKTRISIVEKYQLQGCHDIDILMSTCHCRPFFKVDICRDFSSIRHWGCTVVLALKYAHTHIDKAGRKVEEMKPSKNGPGGSSKTSREMSRMGHTLSASLYTFSTS